MRPENSCPGDIGGGEWHLGLFQGDSESLMAFIWGRKVGYTEVKTWSSGKNTVC